MLVFCLSLLFYFPCILIVHMSLLYIQTKAKPECSAHGKCSVNVRLITWRLTPGLSQSHHPSCQSVWYKWLPSFVIQVPATKWPKSHILPQVPCSYFSKTFLSCLMTVPFLINWLLIADICDPHILLQKSMKKTHTAVRFWGGRYSSSSRIDDWTS